MTNSAGTSGGAIFNLTSTIDIDLGVFQGNTAGDEQLFKPGRGGSIYTDSSADIARSMFSLGGVDSALTEVPEPGQGPAFFAEAPAAVIRFSNSLVSNNTGGVTDCGTLVSLGYNLFDTTQCSFTSSDLIIAPTQIGLLDANGGLTLTHGLLDNSPAIDAGHPLPTFPQFDAGNIQLLQLQGSAILDGNTLFLAGPGENQGSAFVSNPIDPEQNFSATFQFTITPQDNGDDSDGFTFTISDDPTVLDSAIPESGVEHDQFGTRIWTEDGAGAEQLLYEAPGTEIDRGSINIHGPN